MTGGRQQNNLDVIFFSTSKFLDSKQYISGLGSSAWFRNSFCGFSHRALRVQVQRQWKPHCSQVGPAVVGRIISISYKSRVIPGSIYLSIYPILSNLILSYPIYLFKQTLEDLPANIGGMSDTLAEGTRFLFRSYLLFGPCRSPHEKLATIKAWPSEILENQL